MKKTLISIATVLMGLTSGCKDEKLKECMGKVEPLEEVFESQCEKELGKYYDHDPKREEVANELYDLVEKRNKVWDANGCSKYQAQWTCRLVSVGSLGELNYSAEIGYERKDEN